MIKLIYTEGATPLDLDETEGLLPQHITIQSELNEWEQANILDAEDWVFSKKHQHILTIEFIKLLHYKMFDKTWRWAGKFRQSHKNIGVDYHQIIEEIKKLLDDAEYQIKHKSYLVDEIAIRFHHRLVAIHPFSNGNGRHARLMTDLLLVNLGQKKFDWGRHKLINTNEARDQYIKALKQADRGHYEDLLWFARS